MPAVPIMDAVPEIFGTSLEEVPIHSGFNKLLGGDVAKAWQVCVCTLSTHQFGRSGAMLPMNL